MKLRILLPLLVVILISNGMSKPKADSISWGRYFGYSLKGAGAGLLAGGVIGAAAGSSAGNGEFAGLATAIGFADFAIYGTIIGSSVGTGFVAKNKFFTPLAIMAIQLTPAILLTKNDHIDIAFYLGLSSIFITPTLAKLFDKIPPNPPLKSKQNKRKVTVLPMVEPIRKSYGLSINIRF